MYLPTLLLKLLLPLVLAQPGCNQRACTAPAWSNAQRNESALYGYQLVGSGFTHDFKAACEDINSLDRRRWLQVSIDDTYIERAYCDQIGWNHSSYDLILENVKFYNTGLFLTWLLNAFDASLSLPNATTTSTTTTNALTYLCASLSASHLSALTLDSTRILSTICTLSNQTFPPFSNATQPSPTALFDTQQIRSTLLAYVLITTSDTYAQSDTLCSSSYDYIAPLARQHLDGHNVSSLLCGPEGRRQSATELHRKITQWKTKLFVNLVLNASGVEGWGEWLCGNLDAEALRVMGLFGKEAVEAVCWDVKGGGGVWGYCARGPLDGECWEVGHGGVVLVGLGV